MTDKIELSTEVVELSKQLKDKFSYQNGKITFDKDAYKTTLPEGVTYDIAKKVINHNQNYALAVANISGERAVEELAKDKSLDRVKAVAEFYHGKVEHTTYRESTVRNVQTGEETKVAGQTSTRVTISSSGKEFKAIKARIAELAAKKLK